MKKVKMGLCTQNALPVKVSPVVLLSIWMQRDGDFSLIPEVMSDLAQAKSGTTTVIGGIEFTKEGSVIKITGLPEGRSSQSKIASLIVTLTSLLANTTAKGITTLDAA